MGAYCQAHFPPPAVTAAHPLQDQRPPNFPIHEWEELQQLREDSPEEIEAVAWDKYRNSPCSKEFTVDRDYKLQWWKKHGTDYHSGCVEAAVAILAIPGSEVDVKRLFSSGKRQIQNRFLMNPRTMRMCMLMKTHWAEQDKKTRAIAKAAQDVYQAEYAPRRVTMVENSQGAFSQASFSII